MYQLCSRHSKLTRLNVLYRCLGLKGQRCNFSVSGRTCSQQKQPPDEESKAKVDQKSSGYRKQNYDSPISRTFGILYNDISNYLGMVRNRIPFASNDSSSSQLNEPNSFSSVSAQSERIFPSHCDILIVGGGIMGTSIAYHLKERALQGLNIVVVEQDNAVSFSVFKRGCWLLGK